jgi:hypothetical protein
VQCPRLGTGRAAQQQHGAKTDNRPDSHHAVRYATHAGQSKQENSEPVSLPPHAPPTLTSVCAVLPSPFSLLDITTTISGLFCLWDFHPLECQLAFTRFFQGEETYGFSRVIHTEGKAPRGAQRKADNFVQFSRYEV